MTENNYEKLGYLLDDFRFFHLTDIKMRSFSCHYHDFDKLLIFVSGNGRYHVEGKSYELRDYDVVFIPHGYIHAPEIVFDRPYERYIFYISPDFSKKQGEDAGSLETLGNLATEEGRFVWHSDKSAVLKLKNILSDYETAEEAPEVYKRAYLIRLLFETGRLVHERKLLSEEKPAYNKRITEIMEYINTHYDEELSVDTISGRFFLSRYYLMRAFKENTGYTLHGYISQKRLLCARERINAGEAPSRVSAELGYKDYSAFSRAYKKLFGVTPSGNRV